MSRTFPDALRHKLITSPQQTDSHVGSTCSHRRVLRHTTIDASIDERRHESQPYALRKTKNEQGSVIMRQTISERAKKSNNMTYNMNKQHDERRNEREHDDDERRTNNQTNEQSQRRSFLLHIVLPVLSLYPVLSLTELVKWCDILYFTYNARTQSSKIQRASEEVQKLPMGEVRDIKL